MKRRFFRTVEDFNSGPSSLSDLQLGDRCYIQNQSGNYPKRWDRSGTIVEVHGYQSYTLKVDGSGRLTRRNRRHLRRFAPAIHHVTDSSTNKKQFSPPNAKKSSAKPITPDPLPSSFADTFADANLDDLPAPSTSEPPSPSSSTEQPPPVVLIDPPVDRVKSPEPPHRVDIAPQDHPATDVVPSARPSRSIRRPKTYEPETGHWV